jgi:PAS domain S-box-containing protein
MYRISNFMSKKVMVIDSQKSVLEAIDIMRKNSIGSLLVKSKHEIVGIFTERDLLNKIDYNKQENMRAIKVKEVMTGSLKTVDFDESYMNVIELMQKNSIRHIPIVKNKKIIGIASLRDLMGRYKDHLEAQLEIRERELRETLKTTKESEETLRTIFNNSAVAIMLADENERFVIWNNFATQLLGMSDKELLNKPVKSLYPPDEWKKIRSKNIRQLGIKHHMETRVMNKQGEFLDVDISLSVLKDAEGKIAGSVGIMRDITKRKKIEKALLESEQKLKTIVDNVDDVIFQLSSSGLFQYLSPSAERFFSYEPDSFIGQHFSKITQTAESPIVTNAIKKALLGQEVKGLQVSHVDVRGNIVFLEINLTPVKKDGNVIALQGILRDITERKKLEHVKEGFAGMVSHELRTPLLPIREGVSQILDGVHGETTNAQKEFLGIVLSEVDRLKRIVDDLLDVFKLESGKSRLKKQPIDLVSLTKKIISTFYPRAEKKGLKLKTSFFKESIEVYADKDRIMQVFTNLVGNSLKFTEKGSIKISITDEYDCIKCCISDSGKGIAKQDLPKLFEMFRQVGKSSDSMEKGTGLGLAITKDIIELHKGRIYVKSVINKGSKFIFTLPKYTPEELFKESVINSVDNAIDKEVRFSILNFDLQDLEAVGLNIDANKIISIKQVLESLIIDNVRNIGDRVIKNERSIFIVIPDATLRIAEIITGRIKLAFNDYLSKEKMSSDIKVSCKIVCYPEDGSTSEELIKKI